MNSIFKNEITNKPIIKMVKLVLEYLLVELCHLCVFDAI
jgi:hypothetical protein